jgi:hypothetical protein
MARDEFALFLSGFEGDLSLSRGNSLLMTFSSPVVSTILCKRQFCCWQWVDSLAAVVAVRNVESGFCFPHFA